MATPFRAAYNVDHTTGVRLVNTFHVVGDAGAGGTDPDAATVRDALDALLTTKYRACLPTSLTVQTLVVREELAPGDTSVPEEAALTLGLAGTQSTSGDQIALPTCVLVSLYTNAAVRSGHGRIFLPNPGNASHLTTAGNWDVSEAYWTVQLKDFCDALTTQTSHGSFPSTWTLRPVVYSRTRRARGDANWYFDIQSYTRRAQPHWLRRRMTAP